MIELHNFNYSYTDFREMSIKEYWIYLWDLTIRAWLEYLIPAILMIGSIVIVIFVLFVIANFICNKFTNR